MLIIWFDSNNGRFYMRFTRDYYDKFIGFTNQYGHEIFEMYGYNHRTLTWFPCDSYKDYLKKYYKEKPKFKNVIKSKIIDFIYKL